MSKESDALLDEIYHGAIGDPDVTIPMPFKAKAPLDEPHFEKEDRIHNWRNYVPEYLKALWSKLSLDQRLIIYVMAERQASKEEWD